MIEPSHQAMLRTSTAPAQPTIATSGSAERGAHLVDEIGVLDLGVLVDQDERLDVVAVLDLVDDQVVVAEDRADAGEDDLLDRRVGLAQPADPGGGGARVDVGVGYRAGEDEHGAGI